MELNGVNSYYTSYEAASNKKTAVKDTDNSTASKNTSDVAATYESSSDKSSSSTSSVKSNAANPALVAKLKADSDNRMQQLQSLVTTMFKKQGITIGTADDMWKALASGNFTADADTIAKAKEDISEDGYWGVKQTSERIFDFAQALAGDDEEKMKTMKEAVEKGLKLGAKEIWLPTQSAKRHLEKMGQDPAKGIELVRDGKVVPELVDVFKLIRDYDVVLGTAHVSPEEAFVVVEAAKDAGVKKIVITHPEWWVVDMSIDDQIRLVKDYDVILERCYAQNMGGGAYKSNLPDNLELIKAVGYEHVMVDTDGGQTENPHWELALEEYMQYLADHGIPEEHIYHMTRTIPYKLLGIE